MTGFVWGLCPFFSSSIHMYIVAFRTAASEFFSTPLRSCIDDASRPNVSQARTLHIALFWANFLPFLFLCSYYAFLTVVLTKFSSVHNCASSVTWALEIVATVYFSMALFYFFELAPFTAVITLFAAQRFTFVASLITYLLVGRITVSFGYFTGVAHTAFVTLVTSAMYVVPSPYRTNPRFCHDDVRRIAVFISSSGASLAVVSAYVTKTCTHSATLFPYPLF